MLRYKLLYLYYRLRKNSPSASRGKVARFITRKVTTPPGLNAHDVCEIEWGDGECNAEWNNGFYADEDFEELK